MGMFYRWSVDLAGPLTKFKGGNVYVMVMIEHFSKWVEVKALPSKDSIRRAAAMNESVFRRYGAPAEVLTDQGTKFQGEFQTLLDDNLVDH